MQAKQLTVAYPTVQDTVDMDVVGLRGRGDTNEDGLCKRAERDSTSHTGRITLNIKYATYTNTKLVSLNTRRIVPPISSDAL